MTSRTPSTSRIGCQQLRLLIIMASPIRLLVTTDKISDSLVARGFLQADKHGSCSITPSGLRALADEMEAGLVAKAIEAMRHEGQKRRKAE